MTIVRVILLLPCVRPVRPMRRHVILLLRRVPRICAGGCAPMRPPLLARLTRFTRCVMIPLPRHSKPPVRTAVTNCGDGTTTITEQVCADAVQQTCEGASADAFNALCNAYSGQPAQTTACSDNDAATRCYLQEQIDRCAAGS